MSWVQLSETFAVTCKQKQSDSFLGESIEYLQTDLKLSFGTTKTET